MTECRVWVRGGLGNQLSSLCAGFVAVVRRYGEASTLILDASAVNGAPDESRRYQLGSFAISDATDRVVIKETIPRNELTRLFHSAKHKGLNRVSETSFFSGTGLWYPKDIGIGALRNHPKWVDGHFESKEIALEAVDLGLVFPLPLSNPSPEFQALDARTSDYIGVHVRLGDYETWRQGKWILNSDYYRNAIHKLGEDPRSVLIYLFSDDTPSALKLLIEAGVRADNIRLSNLTSPAEVLVHFSRFDRKILSHSTFAWWAGVFGGNGACVFPEPSATMEPLEGWMRLTSE